MYITWCLFHQLTTCYNQERQLDICFFGSPKSSHETKTFSIMGPHLPGTLGFNPHPQQPQVKSESPTPPQILNLAMLSIKFFVMQSLRKLGRSNIPKFYRVKKKKRIPFSKSQPEESL